MFQLKLVCSDVLLIKNKLYHTSSYHLMGMSKGFRKERDGKIGHLIHSSQRLESSNGRYIYVVFKAFLISLSFNSENNAITLSSSNARDFIWPHFWLQQRRF